MNLNLTDGNHRLYALVDGMARKRANELHAEYLLVRRIRRKLAKQKQRLVKSSRALIAADLGTYFVIDLPTNTVIEEHVGLVDLARQLGVRLE